MNMLLFPRGSEEVCKAVAKMARRLCLTYVDTHGISSLVASCLIALDAGQDAACETGIHTMRRI